MKRLSWLFILITLLILAVPASSSFLPTSFGFPTMFSSANNTVFNQAVSKAWDLESLDFTPFGTSTFGFPVVSQSGVQGQSIEATEFAQTTAFTAFSYPAITTGISGFGDFSGFGWL
jgi:hypothetical protein